MAIGAWPCQGGAGTATATDHRATRARRPRPQSATIATEPAIPSSPSIGSSAPISGVGGTAASRFSVKTIPNAMASAAHRSLREQQHQEDERAVRVALVHRGQEAERDQRRRGQAQDERPRPRVAQDREGDDELEDGR